MNEGFRTRTIGGVERAFDQMALRLPGYGGARVFKTFSLNGVERRRGGADLTADEVEAIPRGNLHALINAGFIMPYPPASVAGPTHRFLVRRTDMRYDVVEGRVINEQPIATKAEAEAMIGQEG